MTSSLVGSEMCIRDRGYMWDRARGLPWSVVPEPNEEGAPQAPGPVVVPVSYTHLTLPTICSV
eukprot:3326415-Prorocentrum_lima.AAC.1